MNNKILVAAAHPDDEVLGCGGTILKHIAQGDDVSILILSDGETSRGSKADIKKRQKQAEKAANLMKVKHLFLEKLPDNRFDSPPFLEIVKIVERYVNKVKPNIVLTHHTHDLNIDHRLTLQAVLTACRPQPNQFVKEILAFEVPSSTEWQAKDMDKEHQFNPTVYNNITKFIDKKIEILKVYKDELRDYPHPRSEKGVRVLAQFRGIQNGYEYAEAFKLIRKLNA